MIYFTNYLLYLYILQMIRLKVKLECMKLKFISLKYLLLWKLLCIKYKILYMIGDMKIAISMRRCEKLLKKLESKFIL